MTGNLFNYKLSTPYFTKDYTKYSLYNISIGILINVNHITFSMVLLNNNVAYDMSKDQKAVRDKRKTFLYYSIISGLARKKIKHITYCFF